MKKTNRKKAAAPTKAKKPETTHARLSPSAFKGYEVCPSYLPSKGSTKASERGNVLHDKLEEHEEDAHLHADTEEDVAALEKIGDYLTPFLTEARAKKFKILKEHTFDLRPLGIDGCDQGTGDLAILDRKAGHGDLFDYKMGWWEVDDAEVNIQVWLYSLGLFFEFPWLNTVMARILQPARDEVSEHLFARSDVTAMLLRGRTIADRVNENAGRVFNPVADNCLWCANKANCVTLHAMALRARDQAQLVLPENVDLTPSSFDVEKVPEHAGDVYDFADIIAKWAKDVKWKITGFAVRGEEVPGHHIRETSGKRIIVDPEGSYEVLRDEFGVELSEFLAVSNPSVTGLMKAVASHAEHGDKAKKQAAASTALMGAGVVTSSAPSAYLVRN